MTDDSRDSHVPSEDAVVPPPPREVPIPEGLLSPPDSSTSDAAIAPADVVIPPPPPEAMLPETRRSRPKPAILTGDQPAPVAPDWAQPSVAPEVPTSGGYGVLSAVIFVFLIVLLVAAIAGAVYLGTITFGSSAAESSSVAAASSAVPALWSE